MLWGSDCVTGRAGIRTELRCSSYRASAERVRTRDGCGCGYGYGCGYGARALVGRGHGYGVGNTQSCTQKFELRRKQPSFLLRYASAPCVNEGIKQYGKECV